MTIPTLAAGRRPSGFSNLGGFTTLLAGLAFVLLQLATISGVAYGVVRMQQDALLADRLDAAGAEIERVQRGVLGVVVTEGSDVPRKLIRESIGRLEDMKRSGLLDEAMAASKMDWDRIVSPARLFQQGQDVFIENVEAMVAVGKFEKATGDLAAALAEHSARARLQASGTEANTLRVIVLAAVTNLLGTAFIYWLFFVRVTRPLRHATESASALADGDFSRPIQSNGGEATALLQALTAVQLRLSVMLAEIRSAAQAVLQAADEIATGNRDLATRTESQASTLEQTASSMEELTSTVQQNADNAQHADALARSASEIARKAGDIVIGMGRTMEGITGSSRRIAEIIGVIDGIAFQTNILALNAAVEAARAGDQGRGFAVVAAEVRALAQRSAGAAKEIKGLIDAAAREVEAGSRLARDAGGTMQQVVDSVGGVTGLIASIAGASREQSEGIAQVSVAITQIDAGVQENAALVQQAGMATGAMRNEADALLASISRFRLAVQDGAEWAGVHGRPADAGIDDAIVQARLAPT